MTNLHPFNNRQSPRRKQHGAALMVMLVILIMGGSAILLSSLNSSVARLKRDKITNDALTQSNEALGQAKIALINYAVSVPITNTNSKRLGELPCPDNHPFGDANEGTSSTPCNSNALGRLPWKTLGLGDLRDSSGEHFWYAVSTNFKNSTRTGTLNSDTPGTISVFASNGVLANDGGGSTGAVAVVIAPGEILKRQGSGSLQDRSSAGYNTASNYLDVATVGGSTLDNTSFIDGSSTVGFIQGKIKDSMDALIVNDQLVVISQNDIMQVVQKRVAAEVKLCLNEYAFLNNDRYPWAVPLTDISGYMDQSNLLFGRIPDDFTQTTSDSGSAMVNLWKPACKTHNNNTPSAWWQDWREMVFYALADAYKPGPATPPPACGTCVAVTNISLTADKQFAIIVAGKMLAGQVRTSLANKSNLSNYLESPNSGGATYLQGTPSPLFNDTVIFQK